MRTVARLVLPQSVEGTGREPVQSGFESRERDHAFEAHADVHVLGKDEVESSNLSVGSMPLSFNGRTAVL